VGLLAERAELEEVLTAQLGPHPRQPQHHLLVSLFRFPRNLTETRKRSKRGGGGSDKGKQSQGL